MASYIPVPLLTHCTNTGTLFKSPDKFVHDMFRSIMLSPDLIQIVPGKDIWNFKKSVRYDMFDDMFVH